VELLYERGVTDGLPVVPPTEERVTRMLAATNRDPQEIIGEIGPNYGRASVEKIAINAVMAGCHPSYFPVVLAGVEAMCEEQFCIHGINVTTFSASPMTIINGPVRHQIGVNCGHNAMGHGFRANATIGRALRLVVRNVCRGIPGVLDRASFSNAMRYSFCFGEDEEDSSWVPLHVERGLAPNDSAVTVASVMTLTPVVDFTSRTPEAVCDSILRHLTRGVATDRWLGEDNNVVMVVGPDHRRYFEAEGWSKEDIRKYLWPRFFENGRNRVHLGKPEGLLIAAAGGPGMAETWILFPHLAWAITERIDPPRR